MTEIIFCYALMLLSEVENQPRIAQLGVLQVVQHRHIAGWGETPCDVIGQMRPTKQFHLRLDLQPDDERLIEYKNFVEESLKWSPPDATNGALYFTSNDHKPCHRCILTARIADMRFWK